MYENGIDTRAPDGAKKIHLLVIEHVYDSILPADLQRHRPPRRVGEVSIDIVGNSDSLGLPNVWNQVLRVQLFSNYVHRPP